MIKNKQASTPIPLSPEESDEAARLFGRSLFSALQLAKEKEDQKNRLMSSMLKSDRDVLKIPIPASLMPGQKTAALFGPAPYKSVPPEEEPEPVEGGVAHAKRNLGKYLGSYGGISAGAALGAINALRRNSRSTAGAIKGGLKGSLYGGALGLGLGALLDEQTKQQYRPASESKRKLVQDMLRSGELEQIINEQNKYAADVDEAPEGILARALQSHSNPAKLLSAGQTGFADAKRDYFAREKAQIQKELMQAQKDYIDTLTRIKTGEETNTPHVDAFCNGIAYTTVFDYEKKAEDDVNIEEGSLKRLMGDVLGVAKRPFRPAVDVAASGLLGTGAGMAYLTYLARKKMREQPESYLQESLPTRVELEPY